MDLADCTLKRLHLKRGVEYDADCMCDGDWLYEHMETVIGPEIRAKHHWVRMTTAIRLQIDNAGGHGGSAMITRMTAMMKEKFNIDIVCQPPNSPESNILDLAVWRSIQAVVARLGKHKREHKDILAATVMKAWNAYPGITRGEPIMHTWNRLKEMAERTIASRGSNDFTEARTAGPGKNGVAVVAGAQAALHF